MKYASATAVPIERSKAEIERTLERYGATGFGYLTEGNEAVIAFKVHGHGVRMRLLLPSVEEFVRSPRGRDRTHLVAMKERERAIRQRWRALALVVKAKLAAIESGIATFEDEWLAYLIGPGGRTVGEIVTPQLELGGKQLLLSMSKEERGGPANG